MGNPKKNKHTTKTPRKRRVLNPVRPDSSVPPKTERPEWIIVTEFDRTGDVAYWGTIRDGNDGLTPYQGSALRYATENGALHWAYSLKESGRIGEFKVE